MVSLSWEKFSQAVVLNAFRTFNAISPLFFLLRFDTRSNTSQKLYVWFGYRWWPVFPHIQNGTPFAKADRVGLKGIFRENPHMVNSLEFSMRRANLALKIVKFIKILILYIMALVPTQLRIRTRHPGFFFGPFCQMPRLFVFVR